MRYASLRVTKRVALVTLFAVVFAVSFALVPAKVRAEGGIALSGSFYRQDFLIPQGSSIASPESYVVVFNNSSTEFGVRMTARTPVGVKVTFSNGDFSVPAGGQQKVLVGVEVGPEATPGEDKITVTAEPYSRGGSGVQIAGAAAQTARLTVLGESGSARIQAISPEGEPLVAMVRLFRVSVGQNQEVSYSDKGALQTRVAPGDFVAALYVGGEKRAEESFSVKANETKTVTLTAATVYFEGFGLVPAYETTSGKLAFLKVVYTVRNLYKQVDKAEVTLKVTRDGAPVEQVPLATLGPLDIGRAGLNYNYIPADGWVSGQYGLTLDLKLDGKPYAVSQEQTFGATVESQSSSSKGNTANPIVFAGVGAAALVLAGTAFLLLRRKKKA